MDEDQLLSADNENLSVEEKKQKELVLLAKLSVLQYYDHLTTQLIHAIKSELNKLKP